MPIKIQQSVFDKYYDVIDSTFDIFGVVCQLVYADKVEEVANTFSNIPENKSINSHRRGPDQYKLQDKVFIETEKTEDIKLKIYWNSKDWTKIGGNIVTPNNGIQTIFFATDLNKIIRAKELIAHKDIKSLIEIRFKKHGEPFPMGIGQIRYFGCFWERA